jgi:hypothetical protein
MLQETFSNALTSNAPLSQQPPHIQVPLRLHQRSAIHAMIEKETHLHTGWKLPNAEETLFSDYAFLSDRVGMGKTLMMLGHISAMTTQPPLTPQAMSNLHPSSTAACFSIRPSQTPTTLFSSLVVVPHTIYRQWQETISEQTTLRAYFCKTQRDLDKDTHISSMQESHVTLVSNTLLPLLVNDLKARQIQNPMWSRVVYDEADSIKIPSSCTSPQALFTWFITASFANFLFANQYIHSYHIRQLPTEVLEDFHPEVQTLLQSHLDNRHHLTFFHTQSQGFFQERLKTLHPLRSHLVVHNSRVFLEQSIQLPPLQRQVLRCRALNSQEILESVLPPATEAMLHAGDVDGALRSLGVGVETQLTLVDAVTDIRKKELERLKRLYEFKRQETYATPQAKELALELLEAKVQTLESQLQMLRQRIEQSAQENCSICYEAPSQAVLVPCCSRRFCGSCLLSWLLHQNSCPLCREAISPDRLISISETGGPSESRPLQRLRSKFETLLDIFQANPQGKFLLFSRYEFPLQSLREHLPDTKRILPIQGNKDAIANVLEDFAQGNILALFLNSKSAAAGIHIPAATHVILLHRMGPEEEKQILGRAYRMGRQDALHVIELLHERE